MKVHLISKWHVGTGKTGAGPVVLFQFDLPGAPKTTIAIREEMVGELADSLRNAVGEVAKARH